MREVRCRQSESVPNEFPHDIDDCDTTGGLSGKDTAGPSDGKYVAVEVYVTTGTTSCAVRRLQHLENRRATRSETPRNT